ncbi:Txe/YoeB family addiction module toxin [Cyanobacterium aponinum UTEX 3222]|uniref:Endoribonuclease YoeB n=1 Tax=Cyanobacterium aponinum (strain PCC 10605) TaxID=755178 RepID=K9Z705_CYAAP|nr:Txe/YoeB family addiction module toxin [Cyanobacterium aponinum]AFZ54976.1 addiction module toxin, Txe/YoeB family [Cyanobacterium aponinum PCC 10605]PHV62515.1 Txe/YoeB family addiction module toxin [Cyanobacterium aponinum IPPAS B-1201]WRL40144.1 Txe/YoeB family addiction module toxin [Cyanobacterium aponinum UTEX 3221]WRL43040.1 Txe/YoeB family addiction module toxin [Cyanobacterium aponinum UTEX 3222]
MWEVILSKKAQEDLEKLKNIGLFEKIKQLIAILRENPFLNPPSYEKLVGNLKGCYSRRINLKHRLVYRVIRETKTVEILRMWSHYE